MTQSWKRRRVWRWEEQVFVGKAAASLPVSVASPSQNQLIPASSSTSAWVVAAEFPATCLKSWGIAISALSIAT